MNSVNKIYKIMVNNGKKAKQIIMNIYQPYNKKYRGNNKDKAFYNVLSDIFIYFFFMNRTI